MRGTLIVVAFALASNRGKPGKPERDARDVLRAEDLTRLAADEQSMNAASVELTKLHADRAHLKDNEVRTLAQHAKATKDTIADAHLIIERLKGQVSAQERELHRQAILISGLQSDLAREGNELLGVGPGHVSPDATPTVEKGLEHDVVQSGNALLASTDHPDAVAKQMHALATRAAQLAKSLPQSSAQGTQARALAEQAATLDRAMSHAPAAPAAPASREEVTPARRIAPLPMLKEAPAPIGDALAPSPLKDYLPPLDDLPLHRQPEPQGPMEYDTGAPLRRLHLKARLPEVPEEELAPVAAGQDALPKVAETDDAPEAPEPLDAEATDAEVTDGTDGTAEVMDEADEADDAGP